MLREESHEAVPAPLRYGYTTGTCATATSLAAAYLLLIQQPLTVMQVTLPRGQTTQLELAYCRLQNACAEAGTIKDAGDDPDVTHQSLVFAKVCLIDSAEIRFQAGEGVGIVTRPGLPVPMGEPAINPTPRRMMTEHLEKLARQQGYKGGFQVTIGVRHGEELAKRTLNGRLGIVGGLSILGTTGIVRPFSCAAYIASIHQTIDVARTNGLQHLAACTGAASEQAMRAHYGLPALAVVELGDFVGAVLKYLKTAPVAKLSLAGGFGKISKLAAGHLNLHSHHSQIDFSWLAQQAASLGADHALIHGIQTANTAQQVLTLTQQVSLPLADRICQLARTKALSILPNVVETEVWALDRQGRRVGFAGP
jgi:cobalt-precorrin-5B (C1)-methyltransferase